MMTRLILILCASCVVLTSCTEEKRRKEREDAARAEQAKIWSRANPKYWKITQGTEVWWCHDYGSIGGLVLVDGRLVDLDGSFTAEQVFWKHIPEEWQDQTLKDWKPFPLPEKEK